MMPDYSVFVLVAYSLSALTLTGLWLIVWLGWRRALQRAWRCKQADGFHSAEN